MVALRVPTVRSDTGGGSSCATQQYDSPPSVKTEQNYSPACGNHITETVWEEMIKVHRHVKATPENAGGPTKKLNTIEPYFNIPGFNCFAVTTFSSASPVRISINTVPRQLHSRSIRSKCAVP